MKSALNSGSRDAASQAQYGPKGRLIIPRRYRARLKGRQRVFVSELADGSIVIRPGRSILHLAGSLKLARPLLSPSEEMRRIHAERASRAIANLSRK